MRFELCCLCAVAPMLAGSAAAAAPITAVPSSIYEPPPQAKTAQPIRGVPHDAPRRTIDLAKPSPDDWARLRERNRTDEGVAAKPKALAIGVAREVPASERAIDPARLAWIARLDGSHAARVDVRSQGAAAVRVAVAMPQADGALTLRFAGSASGAQAFDANATEVVRATRRDGVYWSPVLEGDTATIEILAPPGADTSRVALSLVRVAHLAIAGASLVDPAAKDLTDIGSAGVCEVDVACIAPSAGLSAAASASALIVFSDDRFVYECSGTMVGDSTGTGTPYFYTASHCLNSQARASSVNFYWFFQAAACRDRSVPAYALQAGGATMLARSDDWDWALVRANTAPPAGVAFSAWRAEPLPPATSVFTLHHPLGDLTKYSSGTMQFYHLMSDTDTTFADVMFTMGATEPGSSGGGLFTVGPFGYELRGGLWGGSSSCQFAAGSNFFSRMDVALPLLRDYLTPNGASPTGAVPVVEFYHAGLDHYFLATDPVETGLVDAGAAGAWVRTGLRFLAYPDAAHAPADARPVCRFYLTPKVGNSHFYTASQSECSLLVSQFSDSWILESRNVFFIQVPDANGTCPANTRPVWRFYHPSRINHRYTAEATVRDQLRSSGEWIAEGDGPDRVFMCAPAA